jgi:hypothetical protein
MNTPLSPNNITVLDVLYFYTSRLFPFSFSFLLVAHIFVSNLPQLAWDIGFVVVFA